MTSAAPFGLAAPSLPIRDRVPGWLTLLLATACGLSPQAAGLIVTTTQVGYGIGLLLVVPLGDLIENRRLVLLMLGLTIVSLLGAAFATGPGAFLTASLLIGLGSVAVQVLVPYAAHLAPDASRGRVVGNVMSGLMTGIMLARPVASLIADAVSWHAVLVASAIAILALALVLRLALPQRQPAPGLRYGALLASMGRLALHTPILRRRAVSHACLFAAFSLFWTTTPLLLADRFHLSQSGIALFALVGMAGAVAAPIAGRVADRGWSRAATWLAMLAVAAAFGIGLLGGSGSQTGLLALTLAAILLDFGVTANGVLGQRAIYALDAAVRGRLNGLYMATFFAGGAVGSAFGGWAYAQGGWLLTTGIGLVPVLLALLAFSIEPKEDPR